MSSTPSQNKGWTPGVTFWRIMAAVWLVLLVVGIVTGSVVLVVICALMLVWNGLEATGRGAVSRRAR